MAVRQDCLRGVARAAALWKLLLEGKSGGGATVLQIRSGPPQKAGPTRARKNRTPVVPGCGFRMECWTETFSGLGAAWAQVGAERWAVRRGGHRGLARPWERQSRDRDGARESRRFRLRERSEGGRHWVPSQCRSCRRDVPVRWREDWPSGKRRGDMI